MSARAGGRAIHRPNPERRLRVRRGALSVESIGDYTAGPSHVMPTGGSARYMKVRWVSTTF